MKIKGFTLIELLAVIVILAIIALIATPIILNIIEDSKRNAAYQSAQFYIEAVHQTIAKKQMNHILIEDREYTVNELKEFGVKTENSYPTDGILTIQRSKVVLVRDLKINGYTFKMGSDGKLKFDEVERIKPVFNLSYITYNANTATINYSATDKDSGVETVVIDYGLTEAYGQQVEGTEENCTLEGLTNDTKYYYQVTVTDTVGNKLVYKNYFETTMPTAVTIATSNVGNPTLTEYGVKLTSTVTFTLPNEENIKYYYSNDKGKTWKEYTGSFESKWPTVYAMSKNAITGAATITTSTVSVASGYLYANAYDTGENYLSTSFDVSGDYTYKGKLLISEEMKGKQIQISFKTNGVSDFRVYFYDGSDTELSYTSLGNSSSVVTKTVTIREDAEYIKFYSHYAGHTYIYDVKPYTSPSFNATKYYPVLTEYGIEVGYNMVTINYYQTAVKKLYSLDEGETWHDYKNKEIRVEIGKNLLAKSIDKNGLESIIATHAGALPDGALASGAYDTGENYLSTSFDVSGDYTKKGKLLISEEMKGKQIQISFKTNGVSAFRVYFYDGSDTELSYTSLGNSSSIVTKTVTIREDAEYIKFYSHYAGHTYIYDVTVPTE